MFIKGFSIRTKKLPKIYMTLTKLTDLYNKLPIVRDGASNLWKIAFDFYNEHHPEKPLSMHCGGCYLKVKAFLQHYIKTHEQQPTD